MASVWELRAAFVGCLFALACGCEARTPLVYCTDIGCSDSLLLTIGSNGAWLPGGYALDLQLPSGAYQCHFELPLEATANGAPPGVGLDCTAPLDLAVQAEILCSNERSASGSGPAHPCTTVAGHYVVTGSFRQTPPGELSVLLRREDSLLIEEHRTPDYVERYPNKPECGVTCRQAIVALTLPEDAGAPPP